MNHSAITFVLYVFIGLAPLADGCQISERDWKALQTYHKWVIDNSPPKVPITGEDIPLMVGSIHRAGMECVNIGPFRFVHSPKSKAMFILDNLRAKERWEHRAAMSGTLNFTEIRRYLDDFLRIDQETQSLRYGRKSSKAQDLKAISRASEMPLTIQQLKVH